MTERPDDDTPPREKSVAPVQSVDRALLVLEILGKLGTAGVTEIARELGVHKSTVSRLIAVLESRGFVEQLSDRGKYRLGFAIVRLAGSTSAQMDLAKESQPICDELAADSGETTNIAILDAGRIINVVEAVGPAEITCAVGWARAALPMPPRAARCCWPDCRRSACASCSGTAFRVYLRYRHRTGGAGRRTRRGPRSGWASVREELEVGLNAVAAPVRDSGGKIIAALSVSGPSYRLEPGGSRRWHG